MVIGVLALQGDFAEHAHMLRRLGHTPVEVRLPRDLTGLAGLIIPGGESTTIGKLAVTYGLMEPLRAFAQDKPVWGTCAGAIFLSRDAHRDQPLLGLMDITVRRNAYGRQVDSFEADVDVKGIEHAVRGVFIRAPRVDRVGDGVRVLAVHEGHPVVLEQGNLLVASFHPELVGETGLHRYLLGKLGTG